MYSIMYKHYIIMKRLLFTSKTMMNPNFTTLLVMNISEIKAQIGFEYINKAFKVYIEFLRFKMRDRVFLKLLIRISTISIIGNFIIIYYCNNIRRTCNEIRSRIILSG